jgi:hypothetical protein
MMKIAQDDDTYIMTYCGCVNEIRLPNMEFWLSNVDHLTILLETIEECNRRIAGEMQVTRRMTRRQAIVARADAQAQAEQNVRDALNRGMGHPIRVLGLPRLVHRR